MRIKIPTWLKAIIAPFVAILISPYKLHQFIQQPMKNLIMNSAHLIGEEAKDDETTQTMATLLTTGVVTLASLALFYVLIKQSAEISKKQREVDVLKSKAKEIYMQRLAESEKQRLIDEIDQYFTHFSFLVTNNSVIKQKEKTGLEDFLENLNHNTCNNLPLTTLKQLWALAGTLIHIISPSNTRISRNIRDSFKDLSEILQEKEKKPKYQDVLFALPGLKNKLTAEKASRLNIIKLNVLSKKTDRKPIAIEISTPSSKLEQLVRKAMLEKEFRVLSLESNIDLNSPEDWNIVSEAFINNINALYDTYFGATQSKASLAAEKKPEHPKQAQTLVTQSQSSHTVVFGALTPGRKKHPDHKTKQPFLSLEELAELQKTSSTALVPAAPEKKPKQVITVTSYLSGEESWISVWQISAPIEWNHNKQLIPVRHSHKPRPHPLMRSASNRAPSRPLKSKPLPTDSTLIMQMDSDEHNTQLVLQQKQCIPRSIPSSDVPEEKRPPECTEKTLPDYLCGLYREATKAPQRETYYDEVANAEGMVRTAKQQGFEPASILVSATPAPPPPVVHVTSVAPYYAQPHLQPMLLFGGSTPANIIFVPELVPVLIYNC